MIGGGPGSAIGLSHRIAMRMDDRFELVAAVFSRDYDKSCQTADELAMDRDRIYPTYSAMVDAESARDDGIECVVIVTPHDSHFEIAKCFLNTGVHVVCDKPLTLKLEDAIELAQLVKDTGLVFGLTHNYSGYPMVRHAARLVRDGAIGNLRVVQVEHAHGKPLAAHRIWRIDPATGGKASVMYDLGTHAHHLLRFVTGLEVVSVSANLTTMIPDREVFDNAHVNLRLEQGVVGSLWASMAATGNEHGLRFRVYGDQGALEWRHEDAHHLLLRQADSTIQTMTQSQAGLSEDASRHDRVSLGHPEGVFASFANLYSEVADQIAAFKSNQPLESLELGYPTVRDGVIGVGFVVAVEQSSASDGAWTETFRPAP